MTQPRDLSVHLHLDRTSLDTLPEIHLHIHLDGAGQPTVAARKGPTILSDVVVIHEPTGTQPVSVDPTGRICAYGRAEKDGVAAVEVRARIVHGDCPGTVGDPTSSDTLGEIGPVYPTDANYRFLPPGFLIPGADADAYGTKKNCLIIWARYSASGPWECTKLPFFGKSDTETNCAILVPTRPGTAVAERMYPTGYRVWFDRSDTTKGNCDVERAALQLVEGGPIHLQLDASVGTAAAPEWCHESTRQGKWRLRVTKVGGNYQGRLTCGALSQGTLTTALIWNGGSWQWQGANRLMPASPAALKSSGVSCQVEPA